MSAGRRRLLLLSRDHGSVQAILPLIPRLRGDGRLDVRVVSVAVSRPLFDAHGIASEALDEDAFARDPMRCIDQLIERHAPGLIVSGSSPAARSLPETHEQFAILSARRAGVRTLTVLDWWGMYVDRFGTSPSGLDEGLLPDRLAVIDRRSFGDLRELGVEAERLAITHNPWYDRFARQQAAPLRGQAAWRVLFASQPLAETRAARGWTTDQTDLLEVLIDALPPPGAGQAHEVFVWRHPAESPARWGNLTRFQRPHVRVIEDAGRDDDAIRSMDFLVSRHSTLALQALHLGVPCLSLRFDAEDHRALVTDELGISKRLRDGNELKRFLTASHPDELKQDLARQRADFGSRGLVFSDGEATERVLAEVYRLAGNLLE